MKYTGISKNQLCPCGSGKKYKRCCLVNDTNNLKGVKSISSKNVLYQQYSAPDLLKILSLLQLQPKNHGKNIRIEIAIIDIVNNIKETSSITNYDKLRYDIQKACQPNHLEDPAEEFFTENVIFFNGNHIVYPGIATDGAEVLQGLLTAIVTRGALPNQFIKDVMPGILLILYIHNEIAQSFGHTYRMFEENNEQDLFIPVTKDLISQKTYCAFSFVRLANICKRLNIPYNSIDPFVFQWDKEKIPEDLEQNPLLKKPFIFINNEFILVIPTAETICLNEFILEAAEKNNCMDELMSLASAYAEQEVFPMLISMKWSPLRFNFPVKEIGYRNLRIDEQLWRFDTNKLAYSIVLTPDPNNELEDNDYETDSQKLVERITNVSLLIKEAYPASEIMLLSFTNKIRILKRFLLRMEKAENISHQLFFTPTQLQAITHKWKFEELTLWKYAKYKDATTNSLSFAPGNTHLSIFSWYKRNGDSFFDPDHDRLASAFFDFTIESDVRRTGLLKLDKIGIPIVLDGSKGYMHCVRKEEHYPVYISQEFQFGIMRSCLKTFSCPIWFWGAKEHDYEVEIYLNGIMYWLHQMKSEISSLLNLLGTAPIAFIVELDEQIYSLESIPEQSVGEIDFNYSIDENQRQIHFKIPVQLAYLLSTENNDGEKKLMQFVLQLLCRLISLLGNLCTIRSEVDIVNNTMSPPRKKMIIVSTGDKDPRISNVDVSRARNIPDADISHLLDNQIKWLQNLNHGDLNLETKDGKKNVLNLLVALHFNLLREKLFQYDRKKLLHFLMMRHEAILQKKSFRRLTYPVRVSCYDQYYNVADEFKKSESELIEANLAVRILIEFAAASETVGTSVPNNDDIDLLLAHVIQIVTYGTISDEINFEINIPDLIVLPSGRLGIDRKGGKEFLAKFKEAMYNEELDSYSDEFSQFFQQPSNNSEKESDPYMLKVNSAFQKDWGIGLFDILSICYVLMMWCFEQKKSVVEMNINDFYSLVKARTIFTDEQIAAFIEVMAFVKREDILKVPIGFELHDLYPWRYNRRLSYMAKPIIVFENETTSYLFSARHLFSVAENFLSLFYSGTLKINSENRGLKQVLAERNGLNGKKYRNQIFEWLQNFSELDIYPHEIKISPKGFFVATSDKGDIDILAIDRKRNIVYSIECKNTFQSKVAYEYSREIDMYIGSNEKPGLIQKHVNRHHWLLENEIIVAQKLQLDLPITIKSLVISKNILPMKYLRQTALPVFSFYELKNEGFPFKQL